MGGRDLDGVAVVTLAMKPDTKVEELVRENICNRLAFARSGVVLTTALLHDDTGELTLDLYFPHGDERDAEKEARRLFHVLTAHE